MQNLNKHGQMVKFVVDLWGKPLKPRYWLFVIRNSLRTTTNK